MCSIVEDEFENLGSHTMIEDLIISEEGEICKKCKVDKVVITLNLKDGKCRNCFLAYVVHKFRASLGSTKVVQRGSDVLLNFDGSDSAVCLLHMIVDAAKCTYNKKLQFALHLVHIDETSASLTQDSFKNLEKVRQVLSQFESIKCHYASLGSINKLQDIADEQKHSNNDLFLKTLNSIPAVTAKQEFVSRTKNNMLHQIAHDLNCQYIFVPDISINLAKTLLSNISLGRGGSVSDDVQFCDNRSKEIKIIRPVRDFTKLEVKTYLNCMSLKWIDVEVYGSGHGSSASIQNLTAAFVDGLQKNFSSTISTVFKTGDKIKHSPAISEARCAFCKSLVDYHDSPTLHAIEYSRLVSADVPSALNGQPESIQQKAEKAVNGDVGDLQKKLCHGCRNIFTGLDDAGIESILP